MYKRQGASEAGAEDAGVDAGAEDAGVELPHAVKVANSITVTTIKDNTFFISNPPKLFYD